MNNQSALDRLKEIEAEKKEIEATLQSQLESEITFPVYLTTDFLTVKVMSFNDCVYITDSGNDITRCSIGKDFVTKPHTLITEEQFNAKRTEVINKLSNL